MSHSPATPSKGGQHATESSPKSVKYYSTEKLTSTSKVKQASYHEPSPASTYGYTAGSSMPATPQRTGPLTYTLRATSIHPPVEGICYSPSGSRGLNSPLHSDRHAVKKELLDYPSPSTKQTIGDDGCYSSTSSNSSPSSVRLRQNWRSTGKVGEPLKHGAGSFVRRAGNEADDVFSYSRNAGQASVQGDIIRTIFALITALTVGIQGSPRPDQENEPISNNNAQALLPPSACVFVANLTQTQTDDQLEHHVQNAFSQFGTCYVKIRRDTNGMPFAFVQYETEEDAQRAITQGRGMHINNRPCRTEVAKVNRSLYLSRVTGGPISEAEAREALSPYGEIEKVWYSSPTESEIFRLPEGIWVMYKLFQPSRDAQSGFRDHAHYRLEQPPMADEFRSRFRPRQFQSLSPLRARQSPGRMLPSPLRRATTIDLRSIFVGNLPVNINEEQLLRMFEVYGFIQHIEIVRKPSANLTGVNTFAFIEYVIPEGALAAIQASPRIYGNSRLRVERRESTEPSSRLNTFITSGGSPRAPYLGESHDQMAMLYQRGLYAGLTQAVQAQAMPPPLWAGVPYYQPYDASQYGQAAGISAVPSENNTAAGLQTHSSDYMGQPVSQVQYAQPPAQYIPYPHQPHRPFYQWPLPGSTGGNSHASSGVGIQETH